MTSWETFADLSGDGDRDFALSGLVERVRIDVTNTGNGNQVDVSSTFPRWFKLGWWTFFDNTHGLGDAVLQPVYFIDFQHGWYTPPDGVNFFSGGFGGFHFHLYPGVVATFNFGET